MCQSRQEGLKRILFYLMPVAIVVTFVLHSGLYKKYDLIPDSLNYADFHFEETLFVKSHPGNICRREVRVAVGGGITSGLRALMDERGRNKWYKVFSSFISTFCGTASTNFCYDFYFAYDFDDTFFTNKNSLLEFAKQFSDFSASFCSHLRLSLHLVKCRHTHKPAWAQNDAMMEAYLDGAEFFYRVNDDTVFSAHDWTETFIYKLSQFRPPNMGVVGPTHSGGELSILTYDFVHRTHVEVFGFYYPRHFSDWYADTWITEVYAPDKITKIHNVTVKHVMSLGTRYKPSYHLRRFLMDEVIHCKETLAKFEFSKLNPVLRNAKKVVSMSLYGNSTAMNMGAVRNAQLFPVYFPGWTLRIYAYLGNSSNSREEVNSMFDELIVPERIIATLRNLGAKIIPVTPRRAKLWPELWSYKVTNDNDVQYFLIRKAEHRISSRDFGAVDDFIQESKGVGSRDIRNVSSEPVFHCMRDRASHASLSVVPGLWGGDLKAMTKLFGKGGFLKNVVSLINSNKSITESEILDHLLWKNYRHLFHCHDSISCNKWAPVSVSFPNYSSPRKHWETLGVEYDRHEQPTKFSVEVELESGLLVNGLCRNMSSFTNETSRNSTATSRTTRARNLTTVVI